MGINIVEEEYHEGKEISSMDGEEVIRRNDMDDDSDEVNTDGIYTSEAIVRTGRKEDKKMEFDEKIHSGLLKVIDERE